VQRSPEQSSDGDADASSPWPRFSEPGFNAHGQTNAPRNRVPRRRRRKLPVASVLRTGVQMPTNNPTLPGTEFRWRRRRKLPVASVLGTGGSMPTAKTNAPRNRVPRLRKRKLPVASVLRTGDERPRQNPAHPGTEFRGHRKPYHTKTIQTKKAPAPCQDRRFVDSKT
jgi:hypothetical protein